MSLNPTNMLIQASQLPATFIGTPNELFRAMVERMRIVSPTGVSTFVISDVQPSSNQGPWLKGNTQWWVWDESLKTYKPLDISQSETKWFQTGSTIPTVVEPPVWLKTTSGITQPGTSNGTPVGWYLYNGTQWVGFTELIAKEVTFDKWADGVAGALITYDATNRPVLLSLGNANDYLRVNAAGNAVEYRSADSISLVGLLSPQVEGPLTDTSGYHADTQSVTFSLGENRDVLITVTANFVMYPGAGFVGISLSVDGVEKDRSSFAVGAGDDSAYGCGTFTFRGDLAAGNHTVTLDINPGAGGDFVPYVSNGNLPTVKFLIQLL